MDKGIAYSTMVLKAVDNEKREFTGIASTPEPDRVLDIMVPEGAKFTLPMPFLWQHDPLKPVGEIYEAKVTKKGIEVKGRIKNVSAPSQLAARLDEAWVSLREGLVRGLSIGFRPLKYAFLDNGGVQYDEWDFYELSGVTIPMNADCSITSIKSFDTEIRQAASGNKMDKVDKTQPSGASGKTVKLTPKEGKSKMNIADQIKNFQNERAAKVAKMEEIMSKSVDTGESLAEDQAEAYDTLQSEIESIDKHLTRMEGLQKAQLATAKPVTEKSGQSEKGATEVRNYAQVKAAKPAEPGVQMARVVRCLGLAKGNRMEAAEIAKSLYSNDEAVVEMFTKSAVAAATTTDNTWAKPLVPTNNSVIADFLEYLRPQTIIGKFGLDGIPALRNIPFYTRIVEQTSGGSAAWVGEGKAKPVTKFDFTGTTLTPLKVAAISVATEELLNNSSPAAEALIRDGLIAACRERLDIDFVDPAKTASANVSPASITNGVTPITSSGSTAEDIRVDIQALWATYLTNNVNALSAVYIMSAQTALAASLMRNPLGQREFPDLNMRGGMLDGVPVIVSEYMNQLADTAGGMVILVNASDIYLGDEGGFRVDFSREATIQMDTAPTQSSSTSVTATTGVSMFQTNSVAFRAERSLNWAKRRASAVAVLDGVTWGAAA